MRDDPTLVGFDELDLSFGQPLSLLPNPGDQDLLFDCLLIGCLTGECLILGPPSSGLMPRLAEGQRVVVRTKLGHGIALFPSTVLYITETPTFLVYLDYPRDIKFKPVRGAQRVAVALPVLANNQSDANFGHVAGKITDISASGARLEMLSALGNRGHKIELKGKFTVGGIERLLTIQAVIRSCLTERGRNAYGVEFYEGDEEKLLVLLGYTFHALAFGQIKSID